MNSSVWNDIMQVFKLFEWLCFSLEDQVELDPVTDFKACRHSYRYYVYA